MNKIFSLPSQSLPFLILLLSASTAMAQPMAQPTSTQSIETQGSKQFQSPREREKDREAEKLRQACEQAFAEAATAEAIGRTPQPIDPACEEFANEEDPIEPDIVIAVTGTRTARPLMDSTAAITVIERDGIDNRQVLEIDDLVRYEPGVSVRNNLQFGLQDFNIRGIEGNRVLTQVDGIRVPTAFQFGDAVNIARGFNIGRDYFDTETTRRVEIIRGPASALYGSDALGGVVSYFSVDPSNLLSEVGQNSYSEFTSRFNTANQGYTNTVLQAFRAGDAELLLSYTRRDGFTPENVGDEVSTLRNSVLGKLVYNLNETNSLKLTGEIFNDIVDYTTDEENLPLISSTTSSYREEIKTNRYRLSLDYTYDNEDSQKFLEFANVRFYWQDAETTEDNVRDLVGFDFTQRPPARFPAQRVSNNLFVEEVFGGDLQFRSDFNSGAVSHRLSYGLEVSTTFNTRPRKRVQTNLTTNVGTTNAIPDDFPLKDFPDSDTFRFGIYLQDEIEFGGNRWALIPGLRFDRYELKTDPDEDFGRNGAEAADFEGSALSPSIGILYRASDNVSLFGRYSRGFRAPLYSEINSGFSNQIFGYTTLSNPDLEAETSNSFELGVRGDTDRFDFSLVGFYNDYNNFIDFQQVGTTMVNGRDFSLFQNRNIDDARTYGIEATTEYRFSPGAEGFSLRGSLGWTIGDDLNEDEPLVSVDPFEANLGLLYQAPENRWGAELIATFVGKARGNSFEGGNGFIPDAYTVVDLLGYVRISSNLRFDMGLFNIFDTEYFRYGDVRFLDTEEEFFEQRRDRRAQPGTSLRIGLNIEF